MGKSLIPLTTELNYEFSDPDLLELALTHRSKSTKNNERLEFLGDSILNYIISAELFKRFPKISEGDLTRARANLVKKESLSNRARKLKLGSYLRLGSGELKSGGYNRDSILADAFEALLGAIYIDSGIDQATEVVLNIYSEGLAEIDPCAELKDPKTRLQEYLQKQSIPTPVYQIVEVLGDQHKQRFIVECEVQCLDKPVRGEGPSRRNAEQEAAAKALSILPE